MNFHDFFRKFIGLQPRHPSDGDTQPHHFKSPIWDQDDEDYLDDEFRNVPSTPFGFQVFTGDPIDMHRYFEQQFNEMLKNFRGLEGKIFGPDETDLTILPKISPSKVEGPSEENIRDRYLKPSFERSSAASSKTDSDIDGRLDAGDLGAILERTPSIGVQVPKRAFGSTVTETIKVHDGKVEHHKTVRGADGNEKVTVTRQLGEKTHSVTTTTDSKGVSHREEEFVNFGQEELPEFENNWGRVGGAGGGGRAADMNDQIFLMPGGLLSIIDKIFKY